DLRVGARAVLRSGLALLEGLVGLRVRLALLLRRPEDRLAVGPVQDALQRPHDHLLAECASVLEEDLDGVGLREHLEVVLARRLPLADAVRRREEVDDRVSDLRVARRHPPRLQAHGAVLPARLVDVAGAEAADEVVGEPARVALRLRRVLAVLITEDLQRHVRPFSVFIARLRGCAGSGEYAASGGRGAHAAVGSAGGRFSRGPGTPDTPGFRLVCPSTVAIFAERRAPMCGRIARITATAFAPETSAWNIAAFGAGFSESRTFAPMSVAARPTTSRSDMPTRTRG